MLEDMKKWVPMMGFLVVILLYYYIGQHSEIVGLFSDSVRYLRVADYFSIYSEADPVSRYFMQQSVHPPMYSIWLSLVDGSHNNVRAAYFMHYTVVILCFIAYYFWNLGVTNSRTLSIIMVVLFAVMEATISSALDISSEYLFMFFVFLSFIVLDFYQRSEKKYMVACALLSLAMITRTIGVSAVPAIVMGLRKDKVSKWPLYVLLIMSLPIIWGVHGYFFRAGMSYTGQISTHYFELGFIGSFKYIFENMFHVVASWPNLFERGAGRVTQGGSYLLLLLSLAGLVWRLLQLKIDAVYVMFYVGIVILWPFPAQTERLLLPALPFLLTYAVLRIPLLRVNEKAFSVISILILVLVIAPATHAAVTRFYEQHPTELSAYTRTKNWLHADSHLVALQEVDRLKRITMALEHVEKYVPENACFYTNFVEISLMFARRNMVQTPAYLEQNEAAIDVLTRCDYIFMMDFPVEQYEYSFMYPYEHIKEGVEPIFMSSRELTTGGSIPVAMLAKIKH